MIARIWHGVVPVPKPQEYLHLMRTIALPEYQSTPGNRGAWCLSRTEADITHFEMLTFWDDTAAIQQFAGDDSNRADCRSRFFSGFLQSFELPNSVLPTSISAMHRLRRTHLLASGFALASCFHLLSCHRIQQGPIPQRRQHVG